MRDCSWFFLRFIFWHFNVNFCWFFSKSNLFLRFYWFSLLFLGILRRKTIYKSIQIREYYLLLLYWLRFNFLFMNYLHRLFFFIYWRRNFRRNLYWLNNRLTYNRLYFFHFQFLSNRSLKIFLITY